MQHALIEQGGVGHAGLPAAHARHPLPQCAAAAAAAAPAATAAAAPARIATTQTPKRRAPPTTYRSQRARSAASESNHRMPKRCAPCSMRPGQRALPRDIVGDHPLLPEGLGGVQVERQAGEERQAARRWGRAAWGRTWSSRGPGSRPPPRNARRWRAPATAPIPGCRCRSEIRWPAAPGCRWSAASPPSRWRNIRNGLSCA